MRKGERVIPREGILRRDGGKPGVAQAFSHALSRSVLSRPSRVSASGRLRRRGLGCSFDSRRSALPPVPGLSGPPFLSGLLGHGASQSVAFIQSSRQQS